MSITDILPIDRNPASIMVNTMPDVVRPHNFDVEFFVEGLDDEVRKFHYYVTSIDKPKFDFEYDEINQYGYRHNILTGIKYQELSMNILDDSDNKSIQFLYAYLNAAVQGDITPGLLNDTKNTRFNTPGLQHRLATEPQLANIAALGGFNGSGVIIQKIVIHQYVGAGISGSAAGLFGRGGRIRTFTFTDPQLTNIDMAGLAHDSDELSSFDLTFNYKNVSFAVDGAEFPDTPFGFLRAAMFAELAEGIVTTPPEAYAKVATNVLSQVATTALNTGSLPGIAGGAVLAIGERVRQGISPNESKATTSTATTPEVDAEKNKNGYVRNINSPPPSVDVARPIPTSNNQADKLAKL